MREPKRSTWSAMFFPVVPDSPERRRTSAATTEKPRPLSPARAASMAALIDSRLVWRASLPTSSAMLARLADAVDRLRTEPCMWSRAATKPAKCSSSPRSCCSHCESMAARSSTSLADRPAAPWAGDGATIWSSSSRMRAKPCSSCWVASRIWSCAVPRWMDHSCEASPRRSTTWPRAGAGARAAAPGRKRASGCSSQAPTPLVALSDGFPKECSRTVIQKCSVAGVTPWPGQTKRFRRRARTGAGARSTKKRRLENSFPPVCSLSAGQARP